MKKKETSLKPSSQRAVPMHVIKHTRIISLVIIGLVSFMFTCVAVSLLHRANPSRLFSVLYAFIYRSRPYQENMTYEYIDPILLATYIKKEPHQYVLIDMRSPPEYQGGHIPSAINIPAYKDQNAIYETLVDKNSWLWQVGIVARGGKRVIVYSYLPFADLTHDYASYCKQYFPTKILAVGWNEWASYYTQLMSSTSNPIGGVIPAVPMSK